MTPAAATAAAAAAAAGAQSGLDCAADCEAEGNCNRELGRCDCPPLRTGAACERSAAPLCAQLWGLRCVTHVDMHTVTRTCARVHTCMHTSPPPRPPPRRHRRLPYPPCQVWTLNMHEHLDFPASCECLAECQQLNLRVEYAKGCANTTRHALEPENSPRKAQARRRQTGLRWGLVGPRWGQVGLSWGLVDVLYSRYYRRCPTRGTTASATASGCSRRAG